MRGTFNRAVVSTTAIVMMVTLGACSTSGEKGKNAACVGKIASFTFLTGPSPGIGISANNGAMLAVDKFLAQNPSCKIETVIKDSPQVSPSPAKSIAQQLAQDPTVIGVVGPDSSNDALGADSTLSQAGLTLISPSAILPSLATAGNKTFHRVIGDSTSQGPAAARYLTYPLGINKVFIVDDVAAAFSKSIITDLQTRVSTAGEALFNTGQTDFSAIVSQIVASGAQAVFFGGFYTEAGLLVRQLRQAGSPIPFLANSAVLDNAYATIAGSAAEGTIIFSPAAPPETVGGTFITDYQAKYNITPDAYTVEGYDAATIFLTCIKKGKTTRPEMEGCVDAYNGSGLAGPISFTPAGDLNPYFVSVWAYIVQGGKIVPQQQMYAPPSTSP